MVNEWQEGRYGTHTLFLELITCEVWWSHHKERQYDVKVAGHQLKRDYPNLDEAKRAAERFARKALTRALALVPDDPNGGSNG